MPTIYRQTDDNSQKHFTAVLNGLANAGGSTGAAVTTAVSFVHAQYGTPLLPPAGYSVSVTPSQPCFVSVTAKTSSGFNVVLTPLAANAISAGSFDCTVHA